MFKIEIKELSFKIWLLPIPRPRNFSDFLDWSQISNKISELYFVRFLKEIFLLFESFAPLIWNLHRKVLIPSTVWTFQGFSLKPLTGFINLYHNIRFDIVIFGPNVGSLHNLHSHLFDATVLTNSRHLSGKWFASTFVWKLKWI